MSSSSSSSSSASSTVATFSRPASTAVRAEAAVEGVREGALNDDTGPFLLGRRGESEMPLQLGGIRDSSEQAQQRALAAQRQGKSTSRQWAPSALYPGQARPGELQREVVPKNHQEFELLGRNIGPSSVSNVVGGHVGRDRVGSDVTEKFTQRTFDDFKEYYVPRAAERTGRGNAGVYSLFTQQRVESREALFKDTPGRFPGAFRHDIRNPDHPVEKMWHSGAYGEKPTMKADYWMEHRNRDAEHPTREGLRMQYADVYSEKEWGALETLEPVRRKETDVESDVDVTMIRPWSTNPYTPPIGALWGTRA